MPTLHLLIKGKVQGVFYRVSAKKIADKLNIAGWIKNTKEGNVEAMISGADKELQEFANWCRRGPEKAKVEDITVTNEKEISFTGFEIIRK